MKLAIEETKDVEKIVNKVTLEYEEDFGYLFDNCVFQFTKRADPTYDDEGREIAATASKLSNRERDLYGSDFEICVYWPYYETLTVEQKERLIYHELLHCYIEFDDNGDPAYDKDERVKIGCVPHDLVVKTFKQEIEEFGLSESDLAVAEFFYNQYSKYLEEKAKKKVKVKTPKRK